MIKTALLLLAGLRGSQAVSLRLSEALLREILQIVAEHDPHFFLLQALGIKPAVRKIDDYTDAQLQQKIRDYRGETPLFDLLVNTATYFTNSGHHELSARLYREILAQKPDKKTHSLLLQNLLICESSTHESLLAAHKEWAEIYCSHIKPLSVHYRKADPNRKIRIGYACHFFYGGVSNNALLPMLERHDRNKFEIYCYDDGETPQEWRHVADCWRDIRGLSDEKVARLIAEDSIDILQEMNGHCAINRMGVVAHRPAPVQINWYNHTSTTAIPGMTHITTDNVSIIDEDLKWYTEKLYRLDHFYGAVALAGQFEKLNTEPPARKNGYVTFGCLGSTHKHSQMTIALWADVLKAVPGSKMLIKGGPLEYPSYRESFFRLFEESGIPRERILMEGFSQHADLIHSFNRFDVMLDTFPVTGGSTMFEALYNGIPPVTLKGSRWSSRTGAAILTTLGAPELIALTPEEYVAKAKALAGDIDRIAEYRRTLRARMAASTLTNPETYRKDVEGAYLAMWKDWCEQQKQAA